MDPWSDTDSALLIGALAGTYSDAQTTKELLARGGEESNPLFGRKPSGSDIDKGALLAGIAGTTTAALLPQSWRRPMLGAWMGLEAGLAGHNARVPGKAAGKDHPTDLLAALNDGPLIGAALGAGAAALLPSDWKGAVLDATLEANVASILSRVLGSGKDKSPSLVLAGRWNF